LAQAVCKYSRPSRLFIMLCCSSPHGIESVPAGSKGAATDREMLLSSRNQAPRVVISADSMAAYRASRYMLAGILCAVVGGAYSTFITYRFSHDYSRNLNMEGEPFPSGKAYWPPSVSSMVSNIDSPQGKVWLAFMVTSSILTMLSWYPFELKNVYCGEDVAFIPCLPACLKSKAISMNTARTFLPQLGMLGVALIHTAPTNVWDPAQDSTLIFHTGGAIMWIGVTMYTEIYTLGFCETAVIGSCERKLRWACVVLAGIGGACYLVAQSDNPGDLGICCDIEYRPVSMETVEKARRNGAFKIAEKNLDLMEGAKFTPNATAPLYQGMHNSAYGWALAWYMMEFWGEVCAGVFILLDLLVIWFFAEERDLMMPKELPSV